jgi:hypothetical protein
MGLRWKGPFDGVTSTIHDEKAGCRLVAVSVGGRRNSVEEHAETPQIGIGPVLIGQLCSRSVEPGHV